MTYYHKLVITIIVIITMPCNRGPYFLFMGHATVALTEKAVCLFIRHVNAVLDIYIQVFLIQSDSIDRFQCISFTVIVALVLMVFVNVQ